MYQLKDGEEGNNILKSKRLCGKQTNKKKPVRSTASLRRGLRRGLTRGLFSGD